ncbi:MAG: hypothetical protein JSV77_08125 [Dehalococcoidales bacterium]|nr:MAG: hypothetical protein JSV77_08125 [Dehalococcoidales bacterium]
MEKILENVPHLIWNGHDESVLRNDKLTDDLNIVSAIKFTLDYINRPVSKTEVAGLTGAAFYMGWNAKHLFSGQGGSVFQFPYEQEASSHDSPCSCYFNQLFQYMGIHHEIIRKGSRNLWDKICSSINNGVPVIAVEWDPVERRGHSAIACGFDSEEEKFRGRIYEGEKREYYTHITPRDLHYAIVLTPDESWKNKPSGTAMRKLGIQSLANAVKLLEGAFFDDDGGWQLGIGCYETQTRLILKMMNPDVVDGHTYFLLDHFLFWRMQVLLICRSYACEYLHFLLSQNVLDDQKSLLEAIIIEYERFKDYFKSKLTIHANLESATNGRPLIWNHNGNNIPTMQLFVSEEGRREFASFLHNLEQIEEKALSLLRDLVDIYSSV